MKKKSNETSKNDLIFIAFRVIYVVTKGAELNGN